MRQLHTLLMRQQDERNERESWSLEVWTSQRDRRLQSHSHRHWEEGWVLGNPKNRPALLHPQLRPRWSPLSKQVPLLLEQRKQRVLPDDPSWMDVLIGSFMIHPNAQTLDFTIQDALEKAKTSWSEMLWRKQRPPDPLLSWSYLCGLWFCYVSFRI